MYDNLVLYLDNPTDNRKKLFQDALSFAEQGKVLFILYDEIMELPQLSQDINMVNKHYMKMISFLYVKTLDLLIESISTLPEWQSIPSTIILDDLGQFCPKEMIQNACAVVAYLIDTARSCSQVSKTPCRIRISVSEEVGKDYCSTLQDLFCG